jgi:peptide/nickel transport system substrate-binding protein
MPGCRLPVIKLQVAVQQKSETEEKIVRVLLTQQPIRSAAIGVAVASLLIASTSQAQVPKAQPAKQVQPTAQAPKKGGTLNFSVVAEPPNYDCHASTTFALVHPIAPHYSTLLKFDAKAYPAVVGDLAESWSSTPDGLSHTFKLRKNVKFHDGAPFTSADIKASYERIINPPTGVVSARRAYYADVATIETPDPYTVVFKMKVAVSGLMESLASPYNCIYKATKLKENPRYPETEILGTGPFVFVEHVKGSHWSGQRFEGYFRTGLPLLDGYKAFFVKSNAVMPGLMGGQFDAEFRGRSPTEVQQLTPQLKDQFTIGEIPWVSNLQLIFNTKRKPFDDIRVRQALSMAIDRWAGAEALSKISILRYVGGVMRPGYSMELPQAELVKLPGYAKDIAKSREEAKKLLKAAGVETLSFKLLNRNVAEPYSPGGIYFIDQMRRIGVTVEHNQLETKLYLDALQAGNFDVAIEFNSDFMDDPTQQFSKFLTKKASPTAYSGHEDAKIDELYEKQRRTLDPVERKKVVNELDKYVITTAYNVPLLWWQRIIANNKKIKGWYMTPSHYLGQDLAEVWLDQ